MKRKLLALIVGASLLCFCLPAFADGEGGGEGGEDQWIERYFYHYEYIPYVNGSELPRLVYRSIGTTGEQNIASSIGQSTFRINELKGDKNLTGRTNRRDTVAYFDSRTLYRSDVFIFCDFANKTEKSYVIESYPYRDYHFHYYFYETPLSVAGFGYEASPDVGARELKRIYLDRDMLSAYVAEFSPSLLVPAFAEFGSEPRGARKTVRQWGAGNEIHTSYVWELDYDQLNYGFWNFFAEETLEAVAGATEAEKFFRNKEAIETAAAGLISRLNDNAAQHPQQSAPDWTKRALDSKIAISPETLTGYTLPTKQVTRARDVFRMEASILDRYFPSLREVLLIWQSAPDKMAEDALNGRMGSHFNFYGAGGASIYPPWGEIPYDHALTSGVGSWIHWDTKDDSFIFQLFSDDAAALAHWLYGSATRACITKAQLNLPGTLSGNSLDRKGFDYLLSAFMSSRSSLAVQPDLSLGTFQRSLYNSFVNSEALLLSVIEDARVETAKHTWADSFVRNNKNSPWSVLKNPFPKLYNSIVPWTSLSLGLSFLDGGNSTAWKRGIQFELRPVSVFYGTNQGTTVAPMSDVSEVAGIPPAYDDGESFTNSKIKQTVKDWPLSTTFTNSSYDNTALVRYGTARYYPVDLTFLSPLSLALGDALGIPVQTCGEGTINDNFGLLLGEPGSVTTGSFGLGKWNKRAEEMFTDAPESWLNSWNGADERNIAFWGNYGKNSFGWGMGLDTWAPPEKD